MITPLLEPNPSISVSSWLRVFSRSSLAPCWGSLPRARPTASISSMNTMQGLFLGLPEEVADAGCAYADKHFHKV